MTFSLVIVAIAISKKQDLDLEKDLLIGSVRAFIQLMVVGSVLTFIFKSDHPGYIIVTVSFMILIASNNAAKKGKGIPKVFTIVFFSIFLATIVTLSILVGFSVIEFTPRFIIPISGMIVGNAMVAGSIALNNLQREINSRKGLIIAALALGATSRQAAQESIKSSIKAGLIPTIDGMKTIGLVQLPGMMTGAILAGGSPAEAVRLQIMVVFMLSASVAISCSLIGLLTYKMFFTKYHQLNL